MYLSECRIMGVALRLDASIYRQRASIASWCGQSFIAACGGVGWRGLDAVKYLYGTTVDAVLVAVDVFLISSAKVFHIGPY
jgi:hypothetical protein